jgi:hypothetical protein
VRIYLAEGVNRTLVSRRPPAVSGPHDLLDLGSVTIVRPREQEEPDAEPVSFAVPRIATWKILGRSRDDYRMLNATADRQALRRAADATILALGYWPSLREHVALADASPALAAALWDLAGVLLERGRVRDSWNRLSDVVRGVPVDSTIRAEVAERVARARERVDRLNGQVTTRVQHLTRLADETESFVRRQQALDKAREVLRAADYLMDTGDSTGQVDTGADLADHTTAVLAAYQELTA